MLLDVIQDLGYLSFCSGGFQLFLVWYIVYVPELYVFFLQKWDLMLPVLGLQGLFLLHWTPNYS